MAFIRLVVQIDMRSNDLIAKTGSLRELITIDQRYHAAIAAQRPERAAPCAARLSLFMDAAARSNRVPRCFRKAASLRWSRAISRKRRLRWASSGGTA